MCLIFTTFFNCSHCFVSIFFVWAEVVFDRTLKIVCPFCIESTNSRIRHKMCWFTFIIYLYSVLFLHSIYRLNIFNSTRSISRVCLGGIGEMVVEYFTILSLLQIIASNCIMKNGWWLEKYLKRNWRGLIVVLSRYSLGIAEANHQDHNQENGRSMRYLRYLHVFWLLTQEPRSLGDVSREKIFLRVP